MALRSMWSGALQINSLLQAQVAICKGSETYRGKEELRELCACHQKPFTRQTVCEGGRHRITEEKRKSGETDNTAEAVKGVATDSDRYVVLGDDALAAIAKAGTSDTIALAAVLDASDAPLERSAGLYYIRPDKKVKGSAGVLSVFFAALERTEKVAIGRWAPRGREQLVAIYPVNGALVLNILMYESEIREPDETCLISVDEVADPEVDVAIQLIEGLSSDFDFTSAEDSAVAVRQEAIEAARNGKQIPTREPAAKPEVVPDLMAALQAAAKGTPAAKAKKAAAKNGKVPAASAA
jgi:DNA end-binding protein Ku